MQNLWFSRLSFLWRKANRMLRQEGRFWEAVLEDSGDLTYKAWDAHFMLSPLSQRILPTPVSFAPKRGVSSSPREGNILSLDHTQILAWLAPCPSAEENSASAEFTASAEFADSPPEGQAESSSVGKMPSPRLSPSSILEGKVSACFFQSPHFDLLFPIEKVEHIAWLNLDKIVLGKGIAKDKWPLFFQMLQNISEMDPKSHEQKGEEKVALASEADPLVEQGENSAETPFPELDSARAGVKRILASGETLSARALVSEFVVRNPNADTNYQAETKAKCPVASNSNSKPENSRREIC